MALNNLMLRLHSKRFGEYGLSGLWNISILLNFSESKAFTGEALVLADTFFLILLSYVRTSDIFFHLPLKTYILLIIPPETNILYWLTNHRSFRILLLLVSRSNALIYGQSNNNTGAWLIKGPSPYLVREHLFSY